MAVGVVVRTLSEVNRRSQVFLKFYRWTDGRIAASCQTSMYILKDHDTYSIRSHL